MTATISLRDDTYWYGVTITKAADAVFGGVEHIEPERAGPVAVESVVPECTAVGRFATGC